MYISNIIGLILSGAMRRGSARAARRHFHHTPCCLEDLSDHQLRDIGYTRDPGVRSHRHVMWM